ncbi:MAG: 16S rRNA (cytosine(1402)-N(4))-methyltransferase RsmH [Clostridia bacterium]
MEFKHVSILLDECLENLNINPDGVYVDATLGGAGHSYHIASKLKSGKLISIDRDDNALANAKIRLAPFIDNVILVKSDFRDLDEAIKTAGYEKVDGILFDLGVSSPQLDTKERGFSYMQDATLDMRMDQTAELTAHTIVNEWEWHDLRTIIFKYGEDKFANKIAQAIVDNRPINTTLELVEVIKSALPEKVKRAQGHPAKKTFQAIRIAVNDELSSVEIAMQKAVDCLNPGGRAAVITFHSLEDRIVKNIFAENAKGCDCSKKLPVCVCGKTPKITLVKRKPIVPSDAEIEENPRARSAKLRVIEKI